MPTIPLQRFPDGDETLYVDELTAKRYGTKDMCKIWGADRTFDYSLRVQGQAALTLSRLFPKILSPEIAEEINSKANLQNVSADRIRELEKQADHDVFGINTALEEQLSDEAKSHVNKLKTSADTTQPAKALQIKSSLEVIAMTVENLRDIAIEKSLEWINSPHIDTTHGYDALPTVVGRPFAHYAEMLQTGLNFLKFVYNNSVVGKWADATGNHHAAKSIGVDGISLQEEYCRDLEVRWMDASAQVPGLEFEADIFYTLARLGMTVGNLGQFMEEGKKHDVGIFIPKSTSKKRKGSTGMPHKDAFGGNPITEEQAVSMANKGVGLVSTALVNCFMPYARTLFASANSRIDLEDAFKFADHAFRNLTSTLYNMDINTDRATERVLRSYGIVTSPQVLTYLTTESINPMPWRRAHDLLGELAKLSYQTKTDFYKVLRENADVVSRIDDKTLRRITNPLDYIGQSKEIINLVAEKYHGERTLKKGDADKF